LKKQPKRTKRKSAQWYEKEYAALHKLYNNRGISREEYERRMKIITDDLNGVADDDRQAGGVVADYLPPRTIGDGFRSEDPPTATVPTRGPGAGMHGVPNTPTAERTFSLGQIHRGYRSRTSRSSRFR
jgi:hypothetical protein